ncbi:unnamed protein product [Moneuplotes crassus]|uniref:Uncharacterized protein n=1 Tax=Euplotes crassus TaxID=5936 RepID=A0AAD1XGL0_EUPCR|nr:unnamed protein product [Moneuplotes crassus]
MPNFRMSKNFTIKCKLNIIITLLLMIILNTHAETNCIDGFFLKNSKCFKCHISCKACESYNSCTICNDNFVKNDTSTRCDYSGCPDGEYYSESGGACTSCGSSCNFLCAYQSHCLSCPSGEFLDLDTMTCVSTCNSTTQIQISDAQLNNVPLCRSFVYYVDPLSASPVELGTLQHPYKELESVLVELMNFHTNNGRSITVNIMESSINYITVSNTIISNLTSVRFQSYSKVNSDPNLAIIEALDADSKRIQAGVPTKYNILGNKDSLIESKIYTNSGFSADEIENIQKATSAFLSHRTSIYMNKIMFTTDYTSLVTTTIYFNVMSEKAHEFKITNSHIKVAGQMMFTWNPIRLSFQNVDFDYSITRYGVWLRNSVGTIEELSKSYLICDTASFYFSEPKRRDIGQRHIMILFGPGDCILTNINISIYSSNEDSMISLGRIFHYGTGIYTKRFKLQVSNIYITNPEFDTTTVRDSPTLVSFDGSRYGLEMDYEFSNITIDRVHGGGTWPLLRFNPRPTANVSVSDITIKNVDSTLPVISFIEGRAFNLTNIQIINCTIYSSGVVTITAIEALIMNNFIFKNLTLTGSFTNDVIMLEGIENTVFDLNDFQLDQVKIESARSILFLNSQTSLIVSTNRLSVNNTELNEGIAVLMLGKVVTANIDGIIFRNIYPGASTDTSNYMISLTEMESNGNSSLIFSGLDFQSCTVNGFIIGNSKQIGIENQNITIKNSVIANLNYEFFGDLFVTDNVQATIPFRIAFEYVTFSNIQFQRGGNLMKLGHQHEDFLEINHCVFNNIYNAGIDVSAYFSGLAETKKTKVKLLNVTTNTFQANSRRFLILGEGAQVEVHNSTFRGISSVRTGAVIYAGPRKASIECFTTSFYNNTALDGGVFSSTSESYVKCTNCTIYNNHAVSNAVVKVEENGYFIFENSRIFSNFASKRPIGEIFSTSFESTISNCTIEGNIVLSISKMKTLLSTQESLTSTFLTQADTEFATFAESYTSFALEVASGGLALNSKTMLTSQDYFLYIVDSAATVDDCEIRDIIASKNYLNIVQSNLTLSNTVISNISSSEIFIAVSVGGLEVDNVKYTHANNDFLRSAYSQVTVKYFTIDSVVCKENCLALRSSSILEYSHSIFTAVTSNSHGLNEIVDCTVSLINNLTLHETVSSVLLIKFSKIDTIKQLKIYKCTSCFQLILSNVSKIEDSVFKENGISSSLKGGALYSQYSNLTITSSIFSNNVGLNGPAIKILCSSSNPCNSSIENNIFQSNTATSKGGAIYYNFNRPQMINNTFINNSAAYGVNVGSYPISIVLNSTKKDSLILNDVGSGIEYTNDLTFALIDQDGQTTILDDLSTLKFNPISPNASLSGTDFAKVTRGVGSFSEISFNSNPGDQNVHFRITSAAISTYFDISISFRYCKPGEYHDINGKCVVCPYKSYTLLWNQAKCDSCMDHATCLGGTEIYVDNGFWRKTPNSTEIIKCPREDSCLGKYVPGIEEPTECAPGYNGLLCAVCVINDDVKYQPLSNFECSKCPDPFLNLIRVIGVVILAFCFVTAIVVVNIKKKKENNFSVLLRIFTNYIQLITASLSFNANLPSVFTDSFSNTDRISAPNESYFSFDCFVRDYEIKAFAPNSMLLKLFLFLLLPLFLMMIYLVIFGGLKLSMRLMNNNRQIDTTRYMVVTLVCIIFIFHPRMSFESMSLFQCEQVDKDDFRMRNYLEYRCYSSDHLLWIAILAVPMLALWVIGIPAFALYVLIKHRNELESTFIKKYFLVIYQGLKPDRFYWEFVNTMRKLIILCFNVLLFRYRVEYRLLFGMMVLYLFIRLQVRMMPYKREENNQIEMLSLAAGVITLSSGIIFVTEEDAFGMFKILLTMIIFIINSWFLLVWFYLLLCSLGIRNEKFLKLLQIYGTFITKNYKKHLEEEIEAKSLIKKKLRVFGRKNRRNKKGTGKQQKVYKGHLIKRKRSNREEVGHS